MRVKAGKPASCAPVDYEAAADVFMSIFPGANLEQVYGEAVSAARNAKALGFSREALALTETAAVLRRRLFN